MEDRAEEDRRLVESVLAGDPEAFAPLVARYQRLVASIAWRYGSRREELEDVVSEVFLKAYRNLRQFQADHPFSTWLYRLATNQVLDLARQRRRRGTAVELPESLADTTPAPGADLERSQREEHVRQALAELHPRYREALYLVHVEGLKVEEAAQRLGAPSGTLKTRLMRGREALRRLLEERHPEYFRA